MSQLTENGNRDCALAQRRAEYDKDMELKDRLKQARREASSTERPNREMGQSELARRCGVDPSAINKLESGATKTLSGDLLLSISRELGVEPLWLTEGKFPKQRIVAPAQEVFPGDTRCAIRRVRFKLSAGVSGYEIEYDNGEAEPIFMARRWFDQHKYRPEMLLAVKVSGRSMEPSL